jgi:hypothetical protein
MIKLTQERESTPNVWVHPDEEVKPPNSANGAYWNAPILPAAAQFYPLAIFHGLGSLVDPLAQTGGRRYEGDDEGTGGTIHQHARS